MGRGGRDGGWEGGRGVEGRWKEGREGGREGETESERDREEGGKAEWEGRKSVGREEGRGI